jgi:hypothetical protein
MVGGLKQFFKDNKSDLSGVAESVFIWLNSNEKHFDYP